MEGREGERERERERGGGREGGEGRREKGRRGGGGEDKESDKPSHQTAASPYLIKTDSV